MADMPAIHLQPRHIVSYSARPRLQGASDGTVRAELAIVGRTFTLAGGACSQGNTTRRCALRTCTRTSSAARIAAYPSR